MMIEKCADVLSSFSHRAKALDISKETIDKISNAHHLKL